MRKSGFTLVEMLSVVAILVILSLIAIPTYQFIQQRIRQNTYESKVKYILVAAETYASETTYDVVNVMQLIQEGKLEADNEMGEFLNPLTNESMLCDVIRVDLIQNQYIARMTEEKNCDFNELIRQNSLIELKKYREDGTEIASKEWVSGDVTLKVQFKDTDLSSSVTAVSFWGNGEEKNFDVSGDFATKNQIVISASQILNTNYEAKVTVLDDGVVKEYRARSDIRIDKQRPTVYTEEVSINQEDDWTGSGKEIRFTMSDGNGSGISGYAVVTNPDCTRATYVSTSRQSVSETRGNGDYYICVLDNAGNYSEDISTQKVTVSKIDTTPPSVDVNTAVSITSSNSSYHHYNTKLRIVATDESMMSMFISNTGYEQNGTWERYTENKDWNVFANTSLASHPVLDGSSHTVYVSLRDEAGNITRVQNQVPYVLYHECSSEKNKYVTGDFGSCSASCGGGLQYRPYEIRDNRTNTLCSAGSDSQSCNEGPCERPDNYEWSKEITCDADRLQSAVDSGKFKEFIEYQEFRNAMYDCGSVASRIIRRSSSAIAALRSSSRYRLVTTHGTKSRTCKESCPGNCDKNCSNSPACVDTDWYTNAISTVYAGRVLIISASATGRPCTGVVSRCNETCDYSGYCDMDTDDHYLSQWGDILIGQPDGKDYTYATWYTVKSDYKTGDADLVLAFLNGFGATTVHYYDWSSTTNCKWDYRVAWRTDNIAIQYFMI